MELISEELFKIHSPIKEETIISRFVPYIGIARRMYLDEVLGRPLIQELQRQIKLASSNPNDTPYAITPENQALLQMIAPPLSFYTVYQALPFHWAAILNKGITVRESDNSKAVDVNDIAQLRRWLRDDAQVLLQQLIEYLCDCGGNYPLWSPRGYCKGGCGAVKETPYDAGVYFPKNRHKI